MLRRLGACLLFALLTALAADVTPQSRMPEPAFPVVTASRALASNAAGLPVASTTTAAELDFVSGLTSNAQTQINSKLPLAGGVLAGTLDMNGNTILLDGPGVVALNSSVGAASITEGANLLWRATTGGAFHDHYHYDDGAAIGPSLRLFRISASPALNDQIGTISFLGRNSSAADINYGRVIGVITDATAASEDGYIALSAPVNGALTESARIFGSGIRFQTKTATTVPYLDANKELVSSAVTPTELAYLAGVGGVRVRLSGDRTYYVATTGNDSSDCLTVGTPCLTANQAIFLALRDVDTGPTANVIVQLADGTYTGAISMSRPLVGNGFLILQGNVGTPANVIISTTSTDAVSAAGPNVRLQVKGVELRTTTSGNCLRATAYGAVVVSGAMRFGACASAGVQADGYGTATFASNYTIAGNTPNHYLAQQGGTISGSGFTVTVSGTPAFSGAFASVLSGQIYMPGVTFSGSATGTRYSSTLNGVIFSNGGGSSYFPGNSAGTTGTGGQYN